ncbi:MAG: hypothetical protein ACXVPU_11245 [Bacteroidia bacterium]
MKKNILMIMLIFISGFTFAGDINNSKEKESTKLVSGKVIDKKSGEEIAGAEIKINDKIIYSDLNGNFSALIPTTKTEASITFISYNDTKINIDPFSYNTIVVELESK